MEKERSNKACKNSNELCVEVVLEEARLFHHNINLLYSYKKKLKKQKQKQNKVFYIDYIRGSRYALLMTNTTTLPINSTSSFIVFCVFEKHALQHYCIFRLAALPSSSIKQITKLNKQKDSAYLESSLG